MISYQQFQCLVARCDPRAVLVFTSSVEDILPHVLAFSHELQRQIRWCPKDGSMIELFDTCFDGGEWLVTNCMSNVSFDEWRVVGSRLAVVLPNSSFHARKDFRLITFLNAHSAKNLRLFAPQILCQFALVVDEEGSIQSRSDLCPVFQCEANFDDLGGIESVYNTRCQNGRSDPYEQQSIVQKRVAAALESKPLATHSDFIDETLCSLREELEERQKHLADNVDSQVEEELQKDEESKDSFVEGHPAVEIKRRECRKRLLQDVEQSYDWIYPRIVEWAICQCPDVEVVGVNQIPESQTERFSTAWNSVHETCVFASWNGCDILIKSPTPTFDVAFQSKSVHLFKQEAGRHFALRHPKIVQMFGMCEGSIVLETAKGTLEQFLMRCRGERTLLSIRTVLHVMKQVLEGMVYLSSRLVHRDIACRSVVQITTSEFKLGQFGCALPRNDSSDTRGDRIPVRWTPPEGLLGMFTDKSDVWSFGVLCWEVVTYCSQVPYDDHPQAAEAIAKGVTLCKPQSCPSLLWSDIIAPTFTLEADFRPSASEILAKVLRALSRWEILDCTVPLPDDKITFDEANEQYNNAQ